MSRTVHQRKRMIDHRLRIGKIPVVQTVVQVLMERRTECAMPKRRDVLQLLKFVLQPSSALLLGERADRSN